VALVTFFFGLVLIVVSYLWVYLLGRMADSSWHLGRQDAGFVGIVIGIYVTLWIVMWLVGC
jgi:hypothetical protein